MIEQEEGFLFAQTSTASFLSEGFHDAPLNDCGLYLLNIARLREQLEELLELKPVDVYPL